MANPQCLPLRVLAEVIAKRLRRLSMVPQKMRYPICWAFLEEPVANLTRKLTTNNFENQQCSFETKKFFLKLL
jgi:hypothetical protein